MIGGECEVCGCTEGNPCFIFNEGGEVVPCSWANLERTICTNPDCMEAPFYCPTCSIELELHTPFMEAGCNMRMAAALVAAAAGDRLIFRT